MIGRFADRLIGSPSLYGDKQREAEASVNFVTCHDGFTLNDLVSYDRKHNEGNGEDNRDGADDNRCWNCGVEGATNDPVVERLRTRQIKNFFTLTMLSAGMPMMLMGDEVRRTQSGNNNAYCQDNETSWFDLGLVAEQADMHRFVTVLNGCLVSRDIEHEQRMPLSQLIRQAHVIWHGVKLFEPDWSDASHSIAFTSTLPKRRMAFHAILNAYWEPLDFELPPVVVGRVEDCWRRWIDTFLDFPHDIVDWRDAPKVGGPMYRRSRAPSSCSSRPSTRRTFRRKCHDTFSD